MSRSFDPFQKRQLLEFETLFQPAVETMVSMAPLTSQGNRPLQISFEDHLRALVFFHLEENPAGIVFFDVMVLLGSACINQCEIPLRLVGYEVDRVKYWIATNRLDLSAEQIAKTF